MVDRSGNSPLARLQIKVVPGAARDAFSGRLDDHLKLRINATPEKGKANAAVESLIAKTLGLPKSAVRIVAGHSSARKTIQITGLTITVVKEKLGKSES